ncbi:MAG: hypothetical protein JO366_20235 [Methylobacteriaceae bacterium]|nr:hypothetical protein [Methylobacteriaceae bacterium]MBV9247134.1 hypothetical protein [Methylobacteriaceae bacterium]
MKRIAFIVAALAAMASFALPRTAYAANARSWVASTGLDGNPCTRDQPCQTFGHALTQTNVGGEINCVDQGEFGGNGFVISHSITIDCEGVTGGVTTNSGDAIQIQAATSDVVVLRGLDIAASPGGQTGIAIQQAGVVHIEKCVIHDFISSPAQGIQIGPDSNAEVFVSDTIVMNNSGLTGAGIFIVPNSTNIIVKVVLNRVEARNNFFGIKADGTSLGGGVINMTVRDSVSVGNASNGIVATGPASGAAIVMMIDRSAASHNAAGFGVIADGPKTTIRLGGSSIAGNVNGVGVSNGGVLQSYGTNQINGNSNDGIASLTPIGLH